MRHPSEVQLTHDARGHQLTNTGVWTPDSHWIAYDVRPHGGSFSGVTIERVSVPDGQCEVIYHAGDEACVGVVTVAPTLPERYVFIHGPEHPDAQWQYDFHHRRGAIVSADRPGQAETLDALSITAPYLPGALRGGSHVHVFSPDGSRLSFTYNDHVMHEHCPERDQRNIGVALPMGAVRVKKQHSREYDGSHFCVLVSATTPTPRPGSDDITRAYEEGWIGKQGYLKEDGQHQRWALAFIGDTLDLDGRRVAELFIVDLPAEMAAYRCAGDQPLQGTLSSLPAPPAGICQRRLTFTHQRRHPGLATVPRHWVRSAPDGSAIAFLMRDEQGVVQLWLISPNGGEARQITHGAHDVQSAFNWHPDGRSVLMVMDNSVVRCDVASGAVTRITGRTAQPPCADAVIPSPDGRWVAYMREVNGWTQIFVARLTSDGE
ncbi:DUF3748 domain-containing protein [Edwardsiella ictaluri]|uniref:DUF3748 domain-containing protein n=1 Tax=Edwardsiella ictaluri TaxID=67780 RepID=A0ABY8GK11_EDWIC|nr:DUF3748 domain-containing protein [Edwardsiella ictaluri]ELV7527522.1 DUF3748 domain-containing protein [Edwardsiella ictaluri]KMQ79221.1 biopolymer transporter Tol [Edwardsiella ictaluri]KOO55954.1 biopolymer transporter Tol [Edwardsiella ictaluri]WFN97699.1 DUF3748 domain-containing protein [Edwardsiella ictaluri]